MFWILFSPKIIFFVQKNNFSPKKKITWGKKMGQQIIFGEKKKNFFELAGILAVGSKGVKTTIMYQCWLNLILFSQCLFSAGFSSQWLCWRLQFTKETYYWQYWGGRGGGGGRGRRGDKNTCINAGRGTPEGNILC